MRTPPPAGPESPAEPARAIEAGEHNPKAAKRPRTHGREVKVALVYGLDERTKTADGRPVLLDRRVAASTMGIEQFADRLKALVCRWGWRQAKRIAVIGDGAAWIWAWTALHLGEAAFQILDFWHARERLVELGNTLHGPHTEEARTFAKERADRLRNGEAAAVIEDLLESAKKRRGKAREAILAVATYFQNNRARMNYREYERLGLPIGSGSVESLGKSLVQRRMRGPGMRWEPDGAAAVVALRELHANADLDAFWQGDRERRLAAA